MNEQRRSWLGIPLLRLNAALNGRDVAHGEIPGTRSYNIHCVCSSSVVVTAYDFESGRPGLFQKNPE